MERLCTTTRLCRLLRVAIPKNMRYPLLHLTSNLAVVPLTRLDAVSNDTMSIQIPMASSHSQPRR